MSNAITTLKSWKTTLSKNKIKEDIKLKEFSRCNFCKHKIGDYCSQNVFGVKKCEKYDSFDADVCKIIKKAQKSGISVSDVIALMELEK